MLDKDHILPDLSIAATAQHYDLTTVSRDTSDFEKACITVFNPWIEAVPRETECRMSRCV
jgi:predicted nucleic acid-binding protein